MLKLCRTCGGLKLLDEFYASPSGRFGVMARCKACFLGECRHRYRLKNPGLAATAVNLGLREDYFAVIARPVQAYLLGLIAADANVLDHAGGKRSNRITLELASKDAELLELTRAELSIRMPVRTRLRHGRSYSIVAFSSAIMKHDLAEWGVVARKSKNLCWPAGLPSHLTRAFLLGYFDGDGFVTRFRKGDALYGVWGLLRRPSFLESACDVIEAETGFRPGGPWRKEGVHVVRATGRAAYRIDAWLHQDNLGLARKRVIQP